MPHASVLQGLLTACVLAALAFGTADSYSCRRCSANTCHVTRALCEASQSCFSSRQELYFSGQLLAFVEEKGCSESLCASRTFSATLGSNRTFRYALHCCHTELCNQGDFQGPQQSLVPNGITCPACYSENGTPCSPVPLACTGAETRCVEVVGLDRATVTVSAKGCATDAGCNLKNISVLDGRALHTHCVEPRGASPPQLPPASSLLTALLLVLGLT